MTITYTLGTPVPNGISGQFKITHYTIPQEDDPYFHRYGGYDGKGGGNIAITDNNGASWERKLIANMWFAVGNPGDVNNYSVLYNGTGYLNDPNEKQYYGKYLHVAVAEYHGTSPDDPHSLFEILDEKPKPCGGVLEPLTPNAQEVTIAVSQDFLGSGKLYDCDQRFIIDAYPSVIFKIGDAGTFHDQKHFDIYVGEMHKEDFDALYPTPLTGVLVQQVQ